MSQRLGSLQALWIATLLGVVIGLWVGVLVQGNITAVSPVAILAPAPIVTAAPIILRAVLELPSATATREPRPTNVPSSSTSVTINDCGKTPESGALCRMEEAPEPTPTAYPNCPAKPKQWCVWPTATIAPEPTGRKATDHVSR